MTTDPLAPLLALADIAAAVEQARARLDRKSVVAGKGGELGGGRVIKKKHSRGTRERT
ncbi:hypothetical protein [Micromonospora saelicesensis]|uniref:hypothetical protein n=1 Tax=Micromonospora saelicesensis TaxID=285676 RepID=UPI00283A959A|nr:hypothetical protein [Micromonospora saelicesensis]